MFENFDLRFFEFFVRRLLDTSNVVARVPGRQDQLVELQLQGQRVAVLRRLDQKDHKKRHDRRARVDNELPSVAETEQGARDSPDKHDGHCQEKGRRSAGYPGGRDGQPSEPVAVRLRYRGRRAYRQVGAQLNECLAVNEVSISARPIVWARWAYAPATAAVVSVLLSLPARVWPDSRPPTMNKPIAPTSRAIPIANIKDYEVFVLSMGASMIPIADREWFQSGFAQSNPKVGASTEARWIDPRDQNCPKWR